ncbi:hypothetical protein MVEN_01952900 [Mycena venus]|uniref:Uncharacterized protein n=1 Tax=Mycena venus TaxID=2733690 RepID=A0A8H6XFY0_9AGAR|nr:hypothetical protein MVEN_01952900 [Mycena venus]
MRRREGDVSMVLYVQGVVPRCYVPLSSQGPFLFCVVFDSACVPFSYPYLPRVCAPTARTFPITTSAKAKSRRLPRPPELAVPAPADPERDEQHGAGGVLCTLTLPLTPVAVLVFMSYIRYSAAVASLNAREPRTELSCISCRLVLFLIAPSLACFLSFTHRSSLAFILTYSASLVDAHTD